MPNSGPEPQSAIASENEATLRLRRIERKVNVLLGLVVISLVMPFVSSLLGLIQWSAIILVVLIAGALLLAFFRDRVPGVLRNFGRRAVERAFRVNEPTATESQRTLS